MLGVLGLRHEPPNVFPLKATDLLVSIEGPHE